MGMPPFPQPFTLRNTATTKDDRSSRAYLHSEVNAWILAGGLEWIMLEKATEATRKHGEYTMSDVTDAYEKATAIVDNANLVYNKTVNDFRSTIKNDLTSISASSDRVQKETVKLAAAYRSSLSLLNSSEMITAIENAERLAAALLSISQVQPNKIAFAVIENRPQEAEK